MSFDWTTLWAKKDASDGLLWLPLCVHLADTAGVMRLLWEKWLSSHAREAIASGCFLNNAQGGIYDGPLCDDETTESLAAFLGAAHDLGKATPVFQAKRARFPASDTLDAEIDERLSRSGFRIEGDYVSDRAKTVHARASEIFFEHFAIEDGLSKGKAKNIGCILGAHHGKPCKNTYDNLGSYPEYYGHGENDNNWAEAQREIYEYALELAGFEAAGNATGS